MKGKVVCYEYNMKKFAKGELFYQKGEMIMLTSTMALIVGAVLVTIALLFLGICILRCMFRPLLRSSMQLLVSLVCIPVALLAAKAVGGALTDFVLGLFDISALDAVLAALPSAKEAVSSLAQMVISPIVFVFIYLIVWLIIGAIVGGVVRSMEHGRSKVACYRNSGIGAMIGVACALVLVVVFLTPLAGLSGVADDIMDTGILDLKDTDGKELIELTSEERESLDKIVNTPVLKMTRSLGGEDLFRLLSSSTLRGETFSLTAEIENVCDIVEVAIPLVDIDFADLTEEQVKAIEEKIPAVLENSTALRVLGAEALSGLSNAWLKGEEFLEMAAPEKEGITAIVIDSVLMIFVDTTPETIVEDVRGLTPALSAALAVSKLQTGANVEDIVGLLASSAASPKIKGLLLSAGVRILAQELNMYEDKEAIHDAYATALAELSREDLTKEHLVDKISDLNDRFVIDMSQEDIDALADAILHLPFNGGLEGIPSTKLPTPEAVVVPCSQQGGYTVDFLTQTNSLSEWLAQVVAEAAQNTETLNWLTEVENIPTSLMTVEELAAVATSDALEALGAEEIAGLIVVASQLMNGSEESPDIAQVLTAVSDSLSGVAASEKGQELVSALVTGVMQSEKVCESLGITPSQATGLAGSLKESGSLGNLSQTAADVTKLMNIINQLQNGGSADQLTAEELHSLISTMNDSTAELLRSMCSPDMLAKMGLPSDSTKGVSHLMDDLLSGLITARKNWSEEAYQREADALYRILKLAIGAKNSFGETFEERVGMSAEELIETVQASELMLDVLPDSVNELYDETPDALGLSKKISLKDRNHLKNKIEEYKDGANARGDALLDALARMLG